MLHDTDIRGKSCLIDELHDREKGNDCHMEMTHVKSIASYRHVFSLKGKNNKAMLDEASIRRKSYLILELYYREGIWLLHGYDSC